MTRHRHRVLLAAIVFGSMALSILLLDPQPITKDEQQNVTAAYNLAASGVMSTEAARDGEPTADMRREPLYPFLISTALHPGNPSLECLLGGDDQSCQAQRVGLRLVNVLLLAGVVLMTFATGRLVLPERWALAAAAIVGASPALLQYSNRALTEPLAALLLLTGTYCLMRCRTERRGLSRWAIAAGVSFGLLVLVKAIFILVIPMVALAVALRRAAFPDGVRKATLLIVAAVVVIAPWSIRNATTFGNPMPSSGASPVLAVRAESLDMSPTEYVSSFFYNTGVIGPRLASALFADDDYRRHDRDNADSFYRSALSSEANGDLDESDRTPSEKILDQPLKSLGLTLTFAWSGAFGAIPIGTTAPGWWWPPLSQAWLVVGLVGVVLRWLSFLAFFAVIWRSRRNLDLFCLVLPAGLLFAAYAFTTHFIPRYGQPLLPITTICLTIAAHSIWSRRAAAGAPASVPSPACRHVSSG